MGATPDWISKWPTYIKNISTLYAPALKTGDTFGFVGSWHVKDANVPDIIWQFCPSTLAISIDVG